ncbi:Bardet-Biedl syndrome 5 protein homolog [Venturia canescens]|uniref:Bardet-Biedl syndrome 5 protein homolog n=1 Tax=Venturia canescens TaxID=32260 RepID=UPI001C9CF564|nr:Bardet-Biedl syndrome 5 protein homolog [Venturia canescens]
MWQDNEVRFDISVVNLQMRPGELLIDKLDMVEDTKGNAGDRGRLIISNLRIIWHSLTLPRINLSIGYATVVNVTTKNVHTIHGGSTQALYILTTYRGCRYEFIFTNQDFKSSRHYTSAIGVFRAYTSTRMYREIKLRGGFVHESRLTLLPLENVHSTTSGVWNLSTEQGNVGTFIVTNIRLVWFAEMNNQFNVSLPYLTIASVIIRSSKFGPTLVTMSTESSGGYVLGFRVDPLQKLYTLHKEIAAIQAAYEKSPIFGIEYTFEHQAVSQPEYKPEVTKEIEENEDEIANVIGLYFSEEGASQRKPLFSSHLGLAAEEPREGITMQSLWELLPAT